MRIPFERLVNAESSGEVRAAPGRLPARYREVVILSDMDDLFYAEVAGIVGGVAGLVSATCCSRRPCPRAGWARLR
jgi:DNA-directed RNA polymerase specialized sigma24 family protein